MTYSLGDPFSKLEEKFGIPKDSRVNGETEVQAGGYKEITLYKDDAGFFQVRVHNPQASNKPVRECYIMEFGFGGPYGAYSEKIGAEFVGGSFIHLDYPGYSFTFEDGLFGYSLYDISLGPID